MKKLFWWVILTILVVVVAQACRTAEASVLPVNVRAVELWQSQDSAHFAIVWNNQVIRPGQYPIGTYQTRLINASTGDTLATSMVAAPSTSDTLALPWPAVGDTLLIRGAVLAVDIQGNEAQYPDGTVGWATSSAYLFYLGVIPPTPVDSVFIIPIDTIPVMTSMNVLPRYMALELGQTGDFCTMFTFSNGATALNVMGLNADERRYCDDVYARWLAEVEA